MVLQGNKLRQRLQNDAETQVVVDGQSHRVTKVEQRWHIGYQCYQWFVVNESTEFQLEDVDKVI